MKGVCNVRVELRLTKRYTTRSGRSRAIIASASFEDGPRRRNQFVKPLIIIKGKDSIDEPEICPLCNGSTIFPCKTCKGKGQLERGGFNKKNPVNVAKLLGSKWTALENTFGWRHFRVAQKRKTGKEVYALMSATCDEDTQFWINSKNLKDRSRWASGWLQRQQLDKILEGPSCKACSGSGQVPCPYCQ